MTTPRVRPYARRWTTALAAATSAAVLASCSAGAPPRQSTQVTPPRVKIALSEVLLEKDLPSDTPSQVGLPDGSFVLVKAGDAKSGTKLQVREVLHVEKKVGGITVPDKVWDLTIASGKLLNDIKVVYAVPPAPPGAPTPIAGQLDRTTGKWTRIMNATFDEGNRLLEVPFGKSASIGRLQWDWSTAIEGAAKTAAALVGQADGAAPACTSEDEVNSRFDIVVSTVASVAWCAGVFQGADVLRVRNGGRLPVAIVSSGFSLGDTKSGPYGYVDALADELAANQAWKLPAGKQVKVIAPGSELTMTYVRSSTPSEVRAEVDAYSQQVAALAVAAEVATSIFAGQGTPADDLLKAETPLRTSLFRNLTSAQCADTLGAVDQSERRSTDLLAQYVGQLVTSCVGNDMRAELAQAPATAASPQVGSNLAPSDDTDLPADFATQVSRAVALTVDALTQREGLQQLSKVVMEPRAVTSPSAPATTVARSDTTARPTATDPTVPSTPTTTAGPGTTQAGTTPTTPTTPPSTPTTATTVAPTTPTTEPPATSTTLPPTTTTAPATTTTVEPGPPVTVVNTMRYPSAPNPMCTRGAGTVTQPFTVPVDVTELDTVTIGTSSTFTADIEIVRDDGKRLSTRTLRAVGSPGTTDLVRLAVAPGSSLSLVVSNVRGTSDPSVSIDLTTDQVPGLGTATITNTCAEVGNAVFTNTALAVQIIGH